MCDGCENSHVVASEMKALKQQYEKDLAEKEALIVELTNKNICFAESLKHVRNSAHISDTKQIEDMCNKALGYKQ